MRQRHARSAGLARARHRQGPGHRHRRGLPTGRQLRSGGSRRQCAVRRVGHQRRPVLRTARRGAQPQCVGQARLRNAGDRPLH
ncbi:hypothetical protein G6F58_013640 [Rhizopus delemar]|nr:hypothetical protein G6F58_013640 [Rhizopus delemar]